MTTTAITLSQRSSLRSSSVSREFVSSTGIDISEFLSIKKSCIYTLKELDIYSISRIYIVFSIY